MIFNYHSIAVRIDNKTNYLISLGKILIYDLKERIYGFIDSDNVGDDSIKLLDFGIETRFDEHYFFDNRNRENYHGYLFQYTLDGQGYYRFGNTEFEINKGMGFITTFPSDTKYYIKADKKWTFLYIHFSGDYLYRFFKQLYSVNSGVLELSYHSTSIQSFMRVFRNVQQGYKLQRFEGSRFIFDFMTQLITDLETRDETSSLVCMMERYLKQHYYQPDIISNLCDTLNCSHSHLSREFKKQKHITIISCITSLRLEQSIYLLLNTPKSIEEIATECGFSSGNYFSKVFYKKLKVTPSSYRSLH